MIRPTTQGKFFFSDAERQEKHTWDSANGVRFYFRLGLEDTIGLATINDEMPTAPQTYAAISEFIAWHRGEIYSRLNGFKGYDLVKYTF